MKNSLKWITTCGSSHAKLNEFICNLNLFELLVWKMHLMHSNWVTTFDFQCKPGISLYFAGVPQFPMNWPIALTYICCIMKHMDALPWYLCSVGMILNSDEVRPNSSKCYGNKTKFCVDIDWSTFIGTFGFCAFTNKKSICLRATFNKHS